MRFHGTIVLDDLMSLFGYKSTVFGRCFLLISLSDSYRKGQSHSTKHEPNLQSFRIGRTSVGGENVSLAGRGKSLSFEGFTG